LGNIVRAPFDPLQALRPEGAIPDLEVVVAPDQGDVLAELPVGDERRRQVDAALLVRDVLGRAPEEVALQQPGVGQERIELADPGHDRHLPPLPGVDVDAAVEPFREDDAVRQGIAKPRRQGDAALVVDRVLVLAEEHSRGSRVAPTMPHSKPLSPTLQLRPPTWAGASSAAVDP
jgi:hypothetical protein